MITDDGEEVLVQWEWGIKLSHMGKFIPMGFVAIPLEDINEQNDPDFLDGLTELTAEMIHDMIGSKIIPTVRPFCQDFVD